MKEPEAPCLLCKERHVGCQGSCEKYNAYKSEHARWAEIVQKEKIKEHDMSRIEIKRYKK